MQKKYMIEPMYHQTIEVVVSCLAAFTFLQVAATPLDRPEQAWHMILSAMIAIISNLAIKMGTKLIANIKRKKRIKRRINPIKN